eukprot:scpid33963/ scgid30088/ 
MVISCSSESCPGANVKFSSSIRTRFFDVNRCSVLAARPIGRGHSGLQKFCAIMDLPKPVNKTNFQKHQQAAIEAAHTVGEKSRNYAAQQLLAENPEARGHLQVAGACLPKTGRPGTSETVLAWCHTKCQRSIQWCRVAHVPEGSQCRSLCGGARCKSCYMHFQ